VSTYAEQWDRAARRAVERPYLDPLVAAAKRRAHLDLLARWLPDLHGSTVLKTDLWEEGVAGDELLFDLAARCGEAHGIDVSPAVVERARAHVTGAGAAVALAVGDVRSIPMADAVVDAVVSTSTLDHLATPGEHRQALDDIRRVLRPGGALVVTFDNAENVGDPLLRVAARLGSVPFPLGRSLSLSELEALLAGVGFDVVDTTHVVFAPRVAATAAVRTLRLLPAVSDRAVASLLRGFDRLGARFPRRMGCFVAVLARRPG
jgi:SAM-dependent methyltransferase